MIKMQKVLCWLSAIGPKMGITAAICFSLSIYLSCSPKGPLGEDTLIVGTHNFATTYYENRDGEFEGFEFDLTRRFAKSLGKKIEFKIYPGIKEILEALDARHIHFAAAGLTLTPERSEKYLNSTSYQNVTENLFCHKNAHPRTIKSFPKLKIEVIEAGSYEVTLRKIKKEIPTIKWTISPSLVEIFQRMVDRKVDCTLIDSNILSIYQRYYSDFRFRFIVSDEQKLVWYFPQGGEEWVKKANHWLKVAKTDGTLNEIKVRYYGHLSDFDQYGMGIFQKRITERLPKYKKLFKKYALNSGIDWRLLAAVAYQESHWNPDAKSPTGVRGMMMLTLRTAESVGVKNRLDAEESIRGGAKYLAKMIKRIPEHILGADRAYMALASYNVGFSHLKDAKQIVVRLERNPNKWSEVKRALPLLAKKEYYRFLRHGYARGHEPVVYVENIRNYYDLLKRKFPLK